GLGRARGIRQIRGWIDRRAHRISRQRHDPRNAGRVESLVKEPLRFHTLDVFTHSKFAGKPLVVFENADGLARGEMAALAREFNLAAAFACAPRDPVDSASIRVFTPQGEERSFSAQAVIGVAVLLARSRAAEILARREVVVVLEIADEIFSCDVIKSKSGVCYAQFA